MTYKTSASLASVAILLYIFNGIIWFLCSYGNITLINLDIILFINYISDIVSWSFLALYFYKVQSNCGIAFIKTSIKRSSFWTLCGICIVIIRELLIVLENNGFNVIPFFYYFLFYVGWSLVFQFFLQQKLPKANYIYINRKPALLALISCLINIFIAIINAFYIIQSTLWFEIILPIIWGISLLMLGYFWVYIIGHHVIKSEKIF